MVENTLRRNLVFVAGWVAGGLAIAFVVNHFWSRPDSAPVQETHALTPSEIVGSSGSTPTDARLVVPAAAPLQIVNASATSTLPAIPAPAVSSYATAVKASAPAVVSVYTTSRLKAGEVVQTSQGLRYARANERREGLGSGVIVDAQGHIITNEHVIRGADSIHVELVDGRTPQAKVIGTDPDTDLAVLKVDLPPADLPRLPVMTLGRSDLLEVGDVVLAIGTPLDLGLSQTVTQGIISATGRNQMGLSPFEDFLQTDAAINKGNSGGALVNARGELVGINTAFIKDEGAEGLGLAIPVNLVRGVMQDLLKHGHVVRGWIGWVVAVYSEEDSRQRQLPYTGFIVHDLAPNSPARLPGGLEIGDRVEAIDGHPVRITRDVATRVAAHKPGSTVKITGTRRNGQPYSAEIKVIDDPAHQ